MWCRLFFWLRLFDKTAFFIRLLQETFTDILSFIVLYLTIITLYANVLFILNEKREYEGGNRLFEQRMGYGYDFVDAWINSYLLGLGEFEFEFDGPNQGFIMTTFLIATFMIQITFLNMLIAVMGDTFSRVKENSLTSSMRERIRILADYRSVHKVFRIDYSFQYIFVVKPSSQEGGGFDEWSGMV